MVRPLDTALIERVVAHLLRPEYTAPAFTCYMGVSSLGVAQRIATPLIRQMGAETRIFSDGWKLWHAIESHTPDILILEPWLPGIMGVDIIERIRSHPSLAHLPVILMGAITRPSRYHRPPEDHYGADAYIEPNIAIPQLYQIVQELLTRSLQRSGDSLITDPQAAQRYARLLLTDFVLYNADRVRRALQTGQLRTEFASELNELHNYYRRRVAPAIWMRQDYFTQYLEQIERSGEVSAVFQENES